jgi:diguanylate cyclase (GGDEF)-like protein/PAS domain S-box-containing protein
VRQKFFEETFEERSYDVDILDNAGDIVSLKLNVRQDLTGVGARVILTANDITEIAKARQQAEDYLQAGTGSFQIQNEYFETLYVSEKVFDLISQEDVNLINGGDASSLLKFWPDFDHSYWVKHRQEIKALKTGEIWESPEPERILTSSAEERYIIRTRRWFARDNSGARLLYTALQDVTALYVEQEFTNSLLSSSSALIVTQTKDGAIHSVSQAFVDLMGYERDSLVGKDLIDFYHPEDQAEGSAGRKDFQEARQQEISIERRLIDANNQTKTFILNARASNVSAVYDSILTLSDITALKAAEEKLRHLVELDELTGIYSRRGMKHRFGSDQRSEDFGLYLIDLDHFKLVNDAYGHDAGDMLLIATANVLESQTRSEGSCFRLGGEEFALLRPWRGWKDAYDFSENLRELIGATSIESGGRSVQRTASIGVSYLSQNASMSEALKLADIVLREAKERGRNCCVLADEETLADFEARGAFIQASEVQLALERGEMEYFVQPIVGGAENSTIGFEALIRWFLPSGELVGPMKFVDVLYQVIRQPRYAQLQLDLRRQVLEQLKDYPEQYVSFNFTLEQIGYLGGAKALHREIQSILDHPNRQIVIELSDKALHARVNEDVLIEELSQLRAFGYKIALDDFGVESSNIQRLQRYPIDIVKIDRSLISEVTTSETTRRMVGSLAALLKSLELSVTVEGIETQEQAKIINDFGLTTHQGYYYSKPVPPVELLSRVAE